MIRRANLAEIPEILHITRACARHMIERGILQWNNSYPNEAQLITDQQRDELFVLIHSWKLIGCIVITSIKDPEYESVDWLTPDHKNLYIHRLAVHPDYQGMGFARQLMDYAEQLARTREINSIRLDTFSQNSRNQKFYEQRGYTKLGNIYLPGQSEHPFHCYELLLTNAPARNNP